MRRAASFGVSLTALSFVLMSTLENVLAAALALIVLALRLWRENTRTRAALLFHYSLLYLGLPFVALAAAAVG